MKPGFCTALAAAAVASACTPASPPPPATARPVPTLEPPAPPPAPAQDPSATAAQPDTTAEAETDVATDPCEAPELDLDALLGAGRCPLPERLETARTDPGLVARVDAAELDVAPGGTVRVPVVFDNPTGRTATLVLSACADEPGGPGLGLGGDPDASAPKLGGLSRAFGMSVENSRGKRVDLAPGDDVGCLGACSPFGVAVRLPPGAHARANLEYRAEMHRWIQCEDQIAGPLRRGTYQLVVSRETEQHVKTKLVVR